MSSRVDEVMNTSSAAYRSSGYRTCSSTGSPNSSSITARVTPGSDPLASGGVRVTPSFTAKTLADVHSDTSPRSLSSRASAKPARWAFSNSVRLCAHDNVLVPANSDLESRPWCCSASTTLPGSALKSAVNATTSEARPEPGPSNRPPWLRITLTRIFASGQPFRTTNSINLDRNPSRLGGISTCSRAASRAKRSQ